VIRTDRRRRLLIGWALVLTLALSACANKKLATQIDQSLVTSMAALQDSLVAFHKGGKISDDTYGKIMYQMGSLWRLAGQYNILIRDWPGTGAPPKELAKIAGDIAGTVRIVIGLLPDTDTASLKSAEQILAIVEGVLKMVGGDHVAAH
jgi:hypothetical protein